MASKVRLKFRGLSEIVGTEDVGLLVLVDEDGTRQLTITCDSTMLYQFKIRFQHVSVAGKLLPEVLWQALGSQDTSAYQILITDLMEGQYRAVLHHTGTLDMIAIRASDAVLLSYISGLPIYIDADLMQKQSVPYKENQSGLAIPVNTITDDMLNRALEKAIEDENYELASHLRDEKRRRSMKMASHDSSTREGNPI